MQPVYINIHFGPSNMASAVMSSDDTPPLGLNKTHTQSALPQRLVLQPESWISAGQSTETRVQSLATPTTLCYAWYSNVFPEGNAESPSRITSSKILYNFMSICRTAALRKHKKLFKVNVINVSDFIQLKYCISKHFIPFPNAQHFVM